MTKNPDGQHTISIEALDAKRREGIRSWVSQNLGGDVQRMTRLTRWRPLWKVDYTEADGAKKTVLVRGDRPVESVYTLEHEMAVATALKKNGINVPKIFGWCDFPKAFVMEWIETEKDRDSGLIHNVHDNAKEMSPQRWSAMLDYMGKLAEMHAVPPTEFKAIEGYFEPKTAAEVVLNSTERHYAFAEKMGILDPIIEFAMAWLRRNVPQHRTKAHFITGDAGQFMSSGDKVAALVDFEVAYIGDPLFDLSCFRGRHPYENMGDIPALYRRYAEVSGTEIDLPVICYHTASFLTLAAIAARAYLDPEQRDANWIEGVLEYVSCARRTFEAIAELKEIPLDFDLKLPEPHRHAFTDLGFGKLAVDIDRLSTSDAFLPWERDLLASIPEYLHNEARYGRWFEDEAIKDIAAITGQSFATLEAADAALSKLIAEDDASRDVEFVQAMHRRMLRLSMLIIGSDPSDHPLFYRLDPILR